MREKLITPFIVLLALFVASILNIMNKVDNYESMIRLIIVFIVFFIVGKIAEKVIITAINKDKLKNTISEIEDDGMVDMTETEELEEEK